MDPFSCPLNDETPYLLGLAADSMAHETPGSESS